MSFKLNMPDNNIIHLKININKYKSNKNLILFQFI